MTENIWVFWGGFSIQAILFRSWVGNISGILKSYDMYMYNIPVKFGTPEISTIIAWVEKCLKKNISHKLYPVQILCGLHQIYIKIKIALSMDKVLILIKILAESHMAFDLGDKIGIR